MQRDGFGRERKYRSMSPYIYLSDNLGGLVLKKEQKLAVEALLLGKDLLADWEMDHISKLRSGKEIGSFMVHFGCCPASKYYQRPVRMH